MLANLKLRVIVGDQEATGVLAGGWPGRRARNHERGHLSTE